MFHSSHLDATASPLKGEYTISYAEYTQTNVLYRGGWYPCGGLYLTFKLGTNEVLLAPQAPTVPPATQVWRIDPVPTATDQYTIRAAYQKSSAPSYLAYSRNCNKNEPFLAKRPSASVGLRWSMGDDLTQLFRTVNRACGTIFQLVRFAAGTNTSCAVPATAAKQRSLKLVRASPEQPEGWVSWSIAKFVTYPEKLQGDITVCPNWEDQSPSDKNWACNDFGASLAIYKSTIAVGQSAAAYVFKKDEKGKWVRRMLPPAPADNPLVLRKAAYGVAVSADLVVVGVPWYYRKKGSELKRSGKVLLYDKANLGAGPVQLPRPKGSTASFGQIVQASNAFMAVGDVQKIFIYANKLASSAPQTTLAVEGLGSFVLWGSRLAAVSNNTTLIYEYNGSAWVQRAKLDDAGPLTLWNGTLIVSNALAPGQWCPSSVQLKVFERSSAGNWILFQEIEEYWPYVSDYDCMNQYSTPAVDAGTLVFGASQIALVGRSAYKVTHKIFIYTRSGPGRQWTRAATLESVDGDRALGAGVKVVSGDIIASEASGRPQDGSAGPQGMVYVYSREREINKKL